MNDQGAIIICLSVAIAVLAVACSVLACSVPFLFWKCFRLETRIEVLDTTLAEFMELAGLPKAVVK